MSKERTTTASHGTSMAEKPHVADFEFPSFDVAKCPFPYFEAMRGEVRAMREELRDAVAERDSKDHFASELHLAVRESIVNQQAEDKFAARKTDGNATEPAKKSSVYQFSVWSGWPGTDPMELGEDVGN